MQLMAKNIFSSLGSIAWTNDTIMRLEDHRTTTIDERNAVSVKISAPQTRQQEICQAKSHQTLECDGSRS